MCEYEFITLRSSQCTYYQTDPHQWQKFSYTLCPEAAARRRHCDDAEPVDGQTYGDVGSTRQIVCPVCTKLATAAYKRDEAKRLADEQYAIDEDAAYREEKYHYPPPPPPEGRGDKDRRHRHREDRHASERQRREERKEKNQEYEYQSSNEGRKIHRKYRR